MPLNLDPLAEVPADVFEAKMARLRARRQAEQQTALDAERRIALAAEAVFPAAPRDPLCDCGQDVCCCSQWREEAKQEAQAAAEALEAAEAAWNALSPAERKAQEDAQRQAEAEADRSNPGWECPREWQHARAQDRAYEAALRAQADAGIDHNPYGYREDGSEEPVYNRPGDHPGA